jgi:putative endonuclease
MLRCSDGSLYTGATTNVERRFLEHKEGKTGAKYTRSRFPISVVYTESCASRSEAQKREYVVKKLKKTEKEALIRAERLTKSK